MKRSILGFAAAGLLLTPIAAWAADPVTYVCTGRSTAPDRATGVMKTEDTSFQLRIEPDARRVLENGQVMVIRDWSDRRVVYSDYNPGVLSALAGGVVTTFDRKSGAWRDKWGSGKCKVSQAR